MVSLKDKGFVSGLALVTLSAIIAWGITTIPLIGQHFKISPLIMGILLGMLFANTLRRYVPESWSVGIKFCSKTLLRLAIVFYGFRLTLSSLLSVGTSVIIIDVLIVSSVILIGILIGKALRIDQETTLLTAIGSAVCGAAAVLGAESLIKAKPEKTVVAVATVVIFGTLSMLLYPLLYSSGIFSLSPEDMGIYTGATLHEVAHVAGAGAAMSASSGVSSLADIATITKMIRVILLAPTLLLLSITLHKKEKKKSTGKISIPWFAIWFMIMIGVNTLIKHYADVFGLTSAYTECIAVIERVDTFALTMAMCALGMDAMVSKFKEAGIKPFIMAGGLFCWLVGFGYTLTRIIPPLIEKL